MALSIRFKHGRVQLGYFFDKFYHECNPWRDENIGVMDFSLKKSDTPLLQIWIYILQTVCTSGLPIK